MPRLMDHNVRRGHLAARIAYFSTSKPPTSLSKATEDTLGLSCFGFMAVASLEDLVLTL